MRLAIASEYNKRTLKREDIIEKGTFFLLHDYMVIF